MLLLCAGLARPVVAQTLSIPDVPFVAQSEALCGGASLAMVLRYWGVSGVQAEDFAGSLNRKETGIETDVLRGLAESRGLQALAFAGGEAEAVWHLRRGRPLIALLASGEGRYHYVLMLAWANGRVLFHDPAVGPFKTLPEDEWRERWKATGEWALLVFPSRGPATRALSIIPSEPDVAQPSEGGEVSPASELRERASAEFRGKNWSKAAAIAEEASRLDPSDPLTRNLLATSLFLDGRAEAALAAWNHNGEPRLDLIRIDGLSRTSTRVAMKSLGEPSGSLLTPERFRRVGRRAEALPSVQRARVGYRPLGDGIAQIEISVVERSRFSAPLSVLARSAVDGVSDRALGVAGWALAPSGELVQLAGRWRPNRSRGEIRVSSPHAFWLPGVVTIGALWDEQSYRAGAAGGASDLVRERRQRASASLAQWWTADTRLQITIATDNWKGRGRYASLSSEIDHRLLRDHLAVVAKASGWWSPGSRPFDAVSISIAARTRLSPERPRLRARVSYDIASAGSPRGLWSGAGADTSRDGVLRARSLVTSGIIDGAAFGPRLWNAGLQLELPVGLVGPARIGVVAFVDSARVMAPARGPMMVDLGVGVRLRPPGWNSSLRLDVATPRERLQPRLSAGWEKEWR
ncbi:MAG: C39 family peptidase [Vicinamibacteria bacterium]|nr:C39 family peptidase [Vicinamibacteria bacterium]